MLHGKSVGLRAVEKEDAEQIKEWLSDPELLHLLGARPIPISSIDPDKLADMFRLRDGRVLAILSRDQILLGLAAFGNIHEYNRTASLMVMIGDHAEWNRGYGSDAIRTAVRFAFEDLNLNCVEALVPTFNVRALRVFARVGFTQEGMLRSRFFGRGRYWDVAVLSALRDSWTGERAVAEQATAAPAPAPREGEPVVAGAPAYGTYQAPPMAAPPQYPPTQSG